jgi:hypothetical protein
VKQKVLITVVVSVDVDAATPEEATEKANWWWDGDRWSDKKNKVVAENPEGGALWNCLTTTPEGMEAIVEYESVCRGEVIEGHEQMQGAVAAALAADAANMALLTSDELKKKKRRVRTKAKPKPTLIVDNTKTPTGK